MNLESEKKTIEETRRILYQYHQFEVDGSLVGERRIPWVDYKMPERMDGLTVLDIGACCGGFSFEAERRGAKSVLAVDVVERPRFFEMKRRFGSNANWLTCNVYDLPDDKFDAVFFVQVLYHLRHPLLAFEKVISLANQWVMFETAIALDEVPNPAMVYYPEGELGGDITNWWAPNRMLLKAWFKEFNLDYEETWSIPGRVAYMLKKK